MRTLIFRFTAAAAIAAAFLAGILTAATQAPWYLIALRAALAFVVVAAVGYGFELILMRTALRRYYEQSRTALDSRRARGNR